MYADFNIRNNFSNLYRGGIIVLNLLHFGGRSFKFLLFKWLVSLNQGKIITITVIV